MRNRLYIIIFSIVAVFLIIIFSLLGVKWYKDWQLKNAEVLVELKDNLNIEVYSHVRVSDLVSSINGKIVDDFYINTNILGKQEIEFVYINYDKIKISYSFPIVVVDTTAPWIFSSKSFSVTKGYGGNLSEELFCGDNYDDDPSCELIGDVNYNVVGTYPVEFRGTDSNGNISSTYFDLVVKGSSGSGSGSSSYWDFSDIVNKYKNENTKVGLDVSRWQGDIDFQKVKDAGVEFVFVRVGSQRGVGGEYYIDPKFERNVKGFNEVGIPVGIYFYSYANNITNAKIEANWVIEQLKPYKIDLPVVFDWENWSFFQEFKVSFYHLTDIAKAYLKEVENAGYEGMLYSSKNYLENVWFDTKYPVWLAHYTDETNYQGDYKVWQLTANGRVNGINGYVDVNIMYE